VFKRLLSRVNRTPSLVPAAPSRATLESLEKRTLLHNPHVIAVSADNRGEVFITLDSDSSELSASTFNKNSVQMYEAGPNGHLGDADDVRVAASVRYTPSNQRVLVRGPVTAGNGYRVKIVSSRISVPDPFGFDGEFNGTFPSGNGTAGGNFEFQVKNDKSTTPTVRMSTSAGTINLKMRADVAPKSVKNFMAYANSGRYDNVFFTRSVSNFIIQGGSLQISGDGQQAADIVETATFAAVQNEFNISNKRGTIALAKQGGDPNSGTNQFFFNLGDNASNLDTQNGGFTVFAQVKDSASLGVMDSIAGKTPVDLSSQMGPFSSTDISTVPVNNATLAQAGLNPNRDLITIRRVAQISKVAAL
jgi:cyclophilin family peptidyl-prolyl cis-trans isomerase